MLNSFDVELEINGDWHIGVMANDDFLFYTRDNMISIPLNQYPVTIRLVFLGRNYNVIEHSDNYCKIKNLFLNKLKFPYLIQQAEFNSDHLDYRHIPQCDYVNFNGIWQITIGSDTAEQQLKKLI